MWISRKAFDALVADNIKLREESRVLNDQNRTLRTTIEWFMVRTTQLEKERAILVHNYMGVTLETPDYRPQARRSSAPEVDMDLPAVLGTAGMFSDVGDKEARRLGVDWDDDGRVVKSDPA